jgi:hypothetical protein
MSKDATEVFTGISPYGTAFSALTRELTALATTPALLQNPEKAQSTRAIIGSTAMGILLNQAADEIGQPLVNAFGDVARAGDWLVERQPGQECPLALLAKGQSDAVLVAAAAASQNRCVVT